MKLLTYWQSFNEREQISLGFAAIFCIIYLFYLAVYSPLTSAVENKNQQLQEKRETLAWLKKTQKQYREPASAAQPIDSGKLLSLIATELGSPRFKPFPYQMQQTGSDDIQLNFDEIPYNAFITWLWGTTHHFTIHIKELHITHTSKPGIVKLDIIMFP